MHVVDVYVCASVFPLGIFLGFSHFYAFDLCLTQGLIFRGISQISLKAPQNLMQSGISCCILNAFSTWTSSFEVFIHKSVVLLIEA